MVAEESPFQDLPAVSEPSLACFDAVCADVEAEVTELCLAEDDPGAAMGPDAPQMIRNGLGFVTRMLRTTMRFAAGGILENELAWGKTRLPVYGVSASMVLANLERYSCALEKRLSLQAYGEIKPYLCGMVARQRQIMDK